MSTIPLPELLYYLKVLGFLYWGGGKKRKKRKEKVLLIVVKTLEVVEYFDYL